MINSENIKSIFLKIVDEWNCASADKYPLFTDELGHACNDAIKIIEENDKLKSEYDDIKINLDATYRKLYDTEKLCRERQEEIKLLEEVLKDVILISRSRD